MMARPRKSAIAPRKPRSAAPPAAELPKDDESRVNAVSDPLPPTAADTKPNKGGRPSNADKLTKQVAQMTALIGITVGTTINKADGLVIVSNAQDFADALVKLAEVNPRIKRLLEGTVNGSAWAGVIVITGKIGLEIAANHGVKVPALFGSDAPAPADNVRPFAQPVASTNGAQ